MQSFINKSINLPSDPHTAIICGRTNCGKTKFVLDILEGPYYEMFTNIILICPTFKDNATYKERNWISNIIHIDPGKELDKSLEASFKRYKGESTLYIVDDCSALTEMKKKNGMLSKIAFSGRHYKHSLWIITQRYNSVLKDVRTQTQWICMFHCKDKDSLNECLDENDVVPKEERKEIKKMLKENEYKKLILVTIFPYNYIC